MFLVFNVFIILSGFVNDGGGGGGCMFDPVFDQVIKQISFESQSDMILHMPK